MSRAVGKGNGTARPVDSGEVGSRGQRIMISEAEAARRAGGAARKGQVGDNVGRSATRPVMAAGQLWALGPVKISETDDQSVLEDCMVSGDPQLVGYAARNPNATPEMLSEIVESGRDCSVDDLKPNGEIDTRSHSMALAACNALRNGNCPGELVEDALDNGDLVTKMHAARNPVWSDGDVAAGVLSDNMDAIHDSDDVDVLFNGVWPMAEDMGSMSSGVETDLVGQLCSYSTGDPESARSRYSAATLAGLMGNSSVSPDARYHVLKFVAEGRDSGDSDRQFRANDLDMAAYNAVRNTDDPEVLQAAVNLNLHPELVVQKDDVPPRIREAAERQVKINEAVSGV